MVFNEDMNTLFCPYNAQEWGYAIGPVPMDFDFGTLDLAEETRRRIGRDAVFTVLWSSDYAGDQAAVAARRQLGRDLYAITDRKSTRLNSSHLVISYAVFCLKKKK